MRRTQFPFLFLAEGEGSAAGGPTDAPVTAPAATTTPAAPSPADVAAKLAAKTTPTEDTFPRKVVDDLRAENAERRTAATAAEERARTAEAQLADWQQRIAKALGVAQDETPDPAKLAADLEQARQGETAAQASARQATVRAEAVLACARGAHGADPVALLDSAAFGRAIADLDPTAEDFTTRLDGAIKAAVDANPRLKGALQAGASTTAHAGGPGEGSKPLTLDEAVAASYR